MDPTAPPKPTTKKGDEKPAATQQDVALELQGQKASLESARDSDAEKVAALNEWIRAPAALAQEEDACSQRREEALQVMSERLGQARGLFVKQREAALSEAAEQDAFEESKSLDHLERLRQAAAVAAARLASASDSVAQHEARCAAACDVYNVTVERLREEEAAELQELDGGAVRPDLLGKGCPVFAKKRAEDEAFLAARIEYYSSSSGKYLVLFDESNLRTLVDAALIRLHAPKPRDDVEAHYAAAREIAARTRDDELERSQQECGVVDVEALRAASDACDTELKKKVQFLEVKRKKMIEKRLQLEASQAEAEALFSAEQEAAQQRGIYSLSRLGGGGGRGGVVFSSACSCLQRKTPSTPCGSASWRKSAIFMAPKNL
jgi:hypothetical protein